MSTNEPRSASDQKSDLSRTNKVIIGVVLAVIAILGLMGCYFITDNNFHRLIVCFVFGTLGLGFRALVNATNYENYSENKISYPYYWVALLTVISFSFLGFYEILIKLPGTFFYFLAFALFFSAGFIVRTILNGLINKS